MLGNPDAFDDRIVDQINKSIERGRPLGDDGWIKQVAGPLGLEREVKWAA